MKDYLSEVEASKKTGIFDISPIECDFKKGDSVIYTNDNGIEWEMIVVGFSKPDMEWRNGNAFIHLVQENGQLGAWWYPHAPESLRHNSK